MEAVPVGTNWLSGIWPQVAGRIDALCESYMPGRYTGADILVECQEGRKQLWLAADNETGVIHAACITEIVDYPQGKWGRIWGLAGEGMAAWLPTLRTVEQWFALHHCRGIELGGRRGWGRALREYGYQGEAALYERGLGNG